MAKPIDKWTCRVTGCGKPVPWTDWTTCEAHVNAPSDKAIGRLKAAMLKLDRAVESACEARELCDIDMANAIASIEAAITHLGSQGSRHE